MAFVYCDDCNWSQDDFWSESYNPFEHLMGWQDMLLDQDLDESFAGENCMDPGTRREDGTSKTRRDILVEECEKAARRIRNMHWRTDEEMKKEDPPRCPRCKSENLRVD